MSIKKKSSRSYYYGIYENLIDYFEFLQTQYGYPSLHDQFYWDEIESDGIKLHLDVYEHSKKAPTIVFVPGTAIYAMCYGEWLYKLGEAGFNVIGFDPRGHGRSGGVRGDYTISEIISDARNVISYAIEKFNNKVSIMGSSQGGIISFYVAAIEDRIQSAICHTFADLANQDSVRLTRYPSLTHVLRPLLSNFGGVFSDAQIPISLYLDLDTVEVKFFGSARKFIESNPLALKSISLRALRSLAHTPLSKPVEQITTPVMVFQGTNDSIFPMDYTKKIYDNLSCKKRIHFFPGLNHALNTEDVSIILKPVLEWLREIYPTE